MEQRQKQGVDATAVSEPTVFAKIRDIVAKNVPDSIFPEVVRETFTAEKAALIALVVGVAGDIPVYLMTNCLGVLVVVVLSLLGAYLGLYALKMGAALDDKNLKFAEIGMGLSLLNILLVFFVMVPGIRAVGEFEDAANEAQRQLDALGSAF